MSNFAMSDFVRRTPWGRAYILWPLRGMALFATAVLLSGCVINLDSSPSGSGSDSGSSMSSGGSSTDIPTTPVNRLPEPSVGGLDLDLSLLSAGQRAKFDEVEQYLFDHYKALGWKILATTAGLSGDVYDWLDPNSVEGSQEEPPPPLPPEAMQLPEGIQLALTELEVYPWLRGPEGTIPVFRPSFWAYILSDTGATSLEDWISNYQVVGVPSAQHRLYAGMITHAPNQGAQVAISMYGGSIEPGTMSVLEMVVGCRDKTGEMRQQIGIASSRDNMNLLSFRGEVVHPADSLLRVQVEFLTRGASGIDAVGDNKGGWAGIVRGFRPVSRLYPPGTSFPPSMLSTVGGPQFESLYRIQLWQGDWWVAHNGHWLGYYPHVRFDEAPPIDPLDVRTSPNLIATQACEVAWYGEVAAFTSTPWTTTDMGSGHFADEGWQNAAYFRNPTYFGLDNAFYWPDSDPSVMSEEAKPSVPACYTKTPLAPALPPWDRSFYVGGPGGDAPGCQYP